MEQETVYFGENGIIKSAFHKTKKPINVNEVHFEIVLSHKNHMVKIHLNTLLDTDIKVMLFHHHCVQSFLKWMRMLNILIKIVNTWIF